MLSPPDQKKQRTLSQVRSLVAEMFSAFHCRTQLVGIPYVHKLQKFVFMGCRVRSAFSSPSVRSKDCQSCCCSPSSCWPLLQKKLPTLDLNNRASWIWIKALVCTNIKVVLADFVPLEKKEFGLFPTDRNFGESQLSVDWLSGKIAVRKMSGKRFWLDSLFSLKGPWHKLSELHCVCVRLNGIFYTTLITLPMKFSKKWKIQLKEKQIN